MDRIKPKTFYQTITFAILFFGYGFYTLNRRSVSLVLPNLINASILDKSDAVISSQNTAYAISKFLAGILSDKHSPRVLFSLGLIFSGLTTVLFAHSSESLVVFSLLWFCNGFAQGFGWPSCAKILREWFSAEQFATFWSLLSASSNLIGGLAPFAAVSISLVFGWRTTLEIFGTLSIAMSILGLFFLSNRPGEASKPINRQSYGPSFSGKEKNSNTDDLGRSNILDLLKSPMIWLISFAYMIVFATKTSVCDWTQLYMIEDLQKPQMTASSFNSSFETGGFFGGILAGILTDYMIRKHRSSRDVNDEKSSIRLPIATLMILISSLSLHSLCFWIDTDSSLMFINLLAFILGLSLYGPIAIFGVIASESVPKNLSGTSHAIVALAANVGAIISGYPFSLIAQHTDWVGVFFLLECLTLITVLSLHLFGSQILRSSKRDSKIHID
ncbi:Glucose-6-phosphate exchanger SLC37A4 [Sarcoptes scabiei]|nr:Glucose-6-phosphate exchanger SLC37A4 [Sarcoptes scabiei]